jgi:hypothetical protein
VSSSSSDIMMKKPTMRRVARFPAPPSSSTFQFISTMRSQKGQSRYWPLPWNGTHGTAAP